jgi:hypothetical protein
MTGIREADEFIRKLDSPRSEVAARLRGIVLKAAPRSRESFKWGAPCYDLNGLLCSIRPSKSHVALNFFHGAKLVDPDGLLEGSGKQLRHIKVRTNEEVREAAFSKLVRQAMKLNEAK